MNDLISRQAALSLAKDIIIPIKEGYAYKHTCIDPCDIMELPSVQPEIIRCKDCKQFRKWVENLTYCGITESSVFEMDFCSRAERRTDADE